MAPLDKTTSEAGKWGGISERNSGTLGEVKSKICPTAERFK